ncbi:MAG: hypothetical protein JKY48_03560 [Flavobacteriales bacterium]|nr:hypothetical protein [Flavobacteriales bacterium]
MYRSIRNMPYSINTIAILETNSITFTEDGIEAYKKLNVADPFLILLSCGN